MSIRFRFTLFYNLILALTLAVFGLALYTIQARSTMSSLKDDLERSSKEVEGVVSRTVDSHEPLLHQPSHESRPPVPFESFSDDKEFLKMPEREIVRVLDAGGNLVASPLGRGEDALPLSKEGLEALNERKSWWEIDTYQDQQMLIYSQPIDVGGEVAYILQVARPLNERDRSLHALGTTLVLASLLTLVVAFGIGWALSGLTLNPIHRITSTARAIGEERDFNRRVDYAGPQDEIGQLATTFNSMLARLHDAYQQVAHSLEMQRNFVADVSHELRTPLTTLRGNLDLLQRTPPIPDDERADILEDMVAESDRLIRLVGELLTLARNDAGRNLAKEPLDVNPILDKALRQAQIMDPSRQIILEAAPGLEILGDHDAIQQVLLILLDNAIKHSEGDILIQAGRVGDRVEICVQDHGKGIPPEQLEQIFSRFYRGTEGKSSSGVGLGLSIAKSLVEGQGGSIRIESQAGKGSTIICSLMPA